jgi:hypothetical protein
MSGVADHSATFKGVEESAEIDGTEHAPDVAALVEEGYELHTV